MFLHGLVSQATAERKERKEKTSSIKAETSSGRQLCWTQIKKNLGIFLEWTNRASLLVVPSSRTFPSWHLQEITTMPPSLQMNHGRRLAAQMVPLSPPPSLLPPTRSRASFARLDSCSVSCNVNAWGHVAGSFSAWVSIRAAQRYWNNKCDADESRFGSRERTSHLGQAAMYKNHLMRRFKYGSQQGK